MQILLGLQFTQCLIVLMTLFSDFSTPSPQTTESPCEGMALAIVIPAPSLKILPFSDLSPRRHSALCRRWPFLLTPPAPGVLIWARPSHWVVSMHREAAFASFRTGDTASTHAGTQDRGVWNYVCYLLLSNDTPHDSRHLAWLWAANNSPPPQLF